MHPQQRGAPVPVCHYKSAALMFFFPKERWCTWVMEHRSFWNNEEASMRHYKKKSTNAPKSMKHWCDIMVLCTMMKNIRKNLHPPTFATKLDYKWRRDVFFGGVSLQPPLEGAHLVVL